MIDNKSLFNEELDNTIEILKKSISEQQSALEKLEKIKNPVEADDLISEDYESGLDKYAAKLARNGIYTVSALTQYLSWDFVKTARLEDKRNRGYTKRGVSQLASLDGIGKKSATEILEILDVICPADPASPHAVQVFRNVLLGDVYELVKETYKVLWGLRSDYALLSNKDLRSIIEQYRDILESLAKAIESVDHQELDELYVLITEDESVE